MTIQLVLSLILLVNNSLEHCVLVILVAKFPKLEVGLESLLVELRLGTNKSLVLGVFLVFLEEEP